MARRKDPMMQEILRIRRRMSERLLEAERREGTCVRELRRMGRDAASWMSREAAPKSRHSSKGRRKAE
jgi:hypothetical protein